MTDVTREDISNVLSQPVQGDTIEERNANRRLAVEEFLSGTPNIQWTQGKMHDMILSDLESYPEWEKENGS